MIREHPLKPIYQLIDNVDIVQKINKIPEFPRIIEIEVTNHCNFHCLMCKTGTGTSLRKRGFMSDKTFTEVLEQIKGKTIALKFVGQGEPLLHDDFFKFIEKAKNENIVCHLTTNGSLLSEEYLKQLIELELDSIKFSFQGVEPKEYQLLRGKDDFEQLLERVELLNQLRGERKNPFITIGTSIINESKEWTLKFKDRCEKICDKVEIGITSLDYIDLEEIKDDWSKEQINILKQKQVVRKERFRCCHQVFDVITVRWNGDINACCADNDGIMKLGNLSDLTIEQCWNSDKQKIYREILAENRFSDLPLCKDCYDIMGYTIDKKCNGETND